MTDKKPPTNTVRMGADNELTWDNENPLGSVERRRVEAWLGALLQSEHLSLLIGNGLSSAVGFMTGSPPPSMQRSISDSPTDALVKVQSHAKSSAETMGRDPNLEDEIRSAMVLADGLAVLGQDTEEQQVRGAIESAMSDLLERVLTSRRVCGKSI